MGVWWHLIVVFLCIFPMTYDVEQFFLLPIFISLVKYFFKSFDLLMGYLSITIDL